MKMIDNILDMQIYDICKRFFVSYGHRDNTLYLSIDKKYTKIMHLFKMKQCIHLDKASKP